MTLSGLYLLNDNWHPDTEIRVYHGYNCETLELREAIQLYGGKDVLSFSREEVWLYEN